MQSSACIFLLAMAVLAIYGVAGRGFPGHGMLCNPFEDFLSCGGCQGTCADPEPACTAVCRVGCYCRNGELRNASGNCIPPDQCPNAVDYRPTRAAPCGPHEEYLECGVCHKTCDNPNPMCPAQCARGCFCKDEYVRNSNDECVKLKECE